MHILDGFQPSLPFCAGMSKCFGVAMEEVPKKCRPLEASADMAVSNFLFDAYHQSFF
jgi:hypothetical protein